MPRQNPAIIHSISRPPVTKDLPEIKPSVTVIIPYDEGLPFNPVHVCRNDEVLIIRGGKSIGHKRIFGAKIAKNDWLVMLDADGIYPRDYIPKVKELINTLGNALPAMMAWREHIFFKVIPRPLESGLTIRRDFFLRHTKDYPDCARWRGFRTDVQECLPLDIPIIRNGPVYYHPTSHDERTTLKAVIPFILPLLL